MPSKTLSPVEGAAAVRNQSDRPTPVDPGYELTDAGQDLLDAGADLHRTWQSFRRIVWPEVRDSRSMSPQATALRAFVTEMRTIAARHGFEV